MYHIWDLFEYSVLAAPWKIHPEGLMFSYLYREFNRLTVLVPVSQIGWHCFPQKQCYCLTALS